MHPLVLDGLNSQGFDLETPEGVQGLLTPVQRIARNHTADSVRGEGSHSRLRMASTAGGKLDGTER